MARTDPREKITWGQRRAALRYIPPFLKLIWSTNRKLTVCMAALRVIRSLIPLAALWIAKLILDTVIAQRSSGLDSWRLFGLVALEAGIIVAGEALARISALVESLLGDQFSNSTSLRLMEHASRLDLRHYEDPAFYDQLERARRQTTGRIVLLSQLLGMIQDLLTLISLSAALLAYSPLLFVLLVAAVFPAFLGETHFASLEYSLFYRWTPERRLLDYVRYVGASDETAKEVQMFGLSSWLMDRFRTLSGKFYEENRKLAVRKSGVSFALSVLGTAGYYSAYGVILLRAVRGDLTIGSLTFLAGSFSRSRDLIQRLLLGASDIYQQCLYLKDLFDFFNMQPTITSPAGAPAVPDRIREGFVFEDVGYLYPGSERWAVRHIHFRLKPGERIALVGENGAGKTTLTKLLSRLYDPAEGRILLDGRDLRDYDLASVRRAIGVIFQDFVEYDLRFDENIGVGEIDRVREYLDQPEPAEAPDALRDAAQKSLAASLLPRFPLGYRQMLGRRFDGGLDLSGGEWQKVALARAYMRDAQVLILDEPTAALDARAEYEVFQRFADLIAGRMAVIISHRFSTVRMADRILVLNDGAIVEEGSHEELVARKGLYAELFSLQAEGYR